MTIRNYILKVKEKIRRHQLILVLFDISELFAFKDPAGKRRRKKSSRYTAL